MYVLLASRLALRLEQRALAVRVQFARSTNYDFGSFCISILRIVEDFFFLVRILVCEFMFNFDFCALPISPSDEQRALALYADFCSFDEL